MFGREVEALLEEGLLMQPLTAEECSATAAKIWQQAFCCSHTLKRQELTRIAMVWERAAQRAEMEHPSTIPDFTSRDNVVAFLRDRFGTIGQDFLLGLEKRAQVGDVRGLDHADLA